MKKNNRKILMNLLQIIVGSLIFALAINIFALPNNLGEGGVTGITMILYYTLGWSPALTNIAFNAVILVIGWKLLNKETILYTIVAVICLSIFLKVTESLQFVPQEGMLAALGSGALMGVGMGLIMLGEGTTAGSAILAKIMNKFYGWRVSYALLFFDVIVVVASIAVIGVENFLLTIISLFISTKVLDFMLEGMNPKKSVMIISEKQVEISAAIDEKISRGITLLDAVGYYKNEPKKVIYVVVSREQLIPLQHIVNEIDPLAFLTITNVQDVVGEGFTREMFIEEHT